MLNLFLLLAALPAQANSGEMFAEIFAPPGAAQRTRARYEYRHYGDESVTLRQSKGELSVPVSNGDAGSWRASASADYDDISTKERFPNGRQMPNRLWDAGAGVSHQRSLEGGRAAGGTFTVNSPSDRPFGRGRDLGFNLNLNYKIPEENESAWILFVSVSNTRGFLNYIPMLGAAYAFKASDKLRMVVGFPFLVAFWMPSEFVTVTATYFPVRNAELRLGIGPRRGLSGYLLANFRSRTFRLSDRSDKDERLHNEEGLAQAGLNIPLLGPAVTLETGGGWSFARRYYLASGFGGRKDAPRITPGNVGFGFAKLVTAF